MYSGKNVAVSVNGTHLGTWSRIKISPAPKEKPKPVTKIGLKIKPEHNGYISRNWGVNPIETAIKEQLDLKDTEYVYSEPLAAADFSWRKYRAPVKPKTYFIYILK